MLLLCENIFRYVLLLEENIVKKDILEKIAEFCNEAANKGFNAADIENAKYALCAWIDEYIYTNSAMSSQWFSNSLVLSEFNDAEAGKHFFARMESFYKNNNSAPLLELYAKCILFGFMGKFRMESEAELKQILSSAIAKTKLRLEPLNYKPMSKTKRIFSFRRGIKNILITGNLEFAKNRNAPKGYKFIYSDLKNKEELPFLDAVIVVDECDMNIEQKTPVYRVLNLDVAEIDCTFDKNYEFCTNHLNYYLHKYFLEAVHVKSILSFPKKLQQFKSSNAFYTSPFFPFMEQEKPVAYSLAKRVFLVVFLLSILFSVAMGYKEKVKKYDIKFKRDSIQNTQDSLDFEFKKNLKNLEFMYKKQVLEKFPFKEGINPNFAEVSAYFSKDGDFFKFMDILDTAYYNVYTKYDNKYIKYDNIIQFNKKTLDMLNILKNNVWENIAVSVVVNAPKMAAITVEIDSQFVEIERGKSKVIETIFPPKNKNEIVITAKTVNKMFEEKLSGLLNVGERKEISFETHSYLIDVELNVLWHLPKNAIHPKDWHTLKLGTLTLNQGE